jgi:hypothetical protein
MDCDLLFDHGAFHSYKNCIALADQLSTTFLFDNTGSISKHEASMVRLVNDELEKIWNKAIMV